MRESQEMTYIGVSGRADVISGSLLARLLEEHQALQLFPLHAIHIGKCAEFLTYRMREKHRQDVRITRQ